MRWSSLRRGRRSSLRAAALVAVLSVSLAACGSDSAEPEEGTADTAAPGGDAAPDLGTLRVIFGAPNTHVYMALQKGEELGAWDDTGLEVEVIEGTNTSVQQALASASADIGMQSGFTAFQNMTQGVPATVVGANSLFRSQSLVVSTDSPYESVDDLLDEPPVFGVTSYTSQGYAGTVALTSDLGMEEDKDFSIVALGGINELAAAFERGTINAFFWSPAVAFDLEDKGEARIIARADEYLDPSVANAITVLNDVIEERPAAVKAYVDGYFKTVQMLQENPDIVEQILTEDWGISPGAAALIAEREMPTISTDGEIPDENLEGVTDEVMENYEGTDEFDAAEYYTHWQDLPDE